MACTLQELQKTEYEILCKFADFCEAHNIPYTLTGGTLLGAIRHNGFIPWDDDVDVEMSSQAFKRFARCIRRHPIPGLHFSWIDTDPQYPFYFAKLRKNGTFMPEDNMTSFDMHNGVWVDIFIYTGWPKNKRIAQLQRKLYFIFATASRLEVYNQIDSEKTEDETAYNYKYRFLKKLSPKQMLRLRKFLFFAYTSLGSRKSEYVTVNDWTLHPKKPILRSCETPICKHAFWDRELCVPVNYDARLTVQYGDYMTPKQYPCHTDLSKIQL